MEILPLGELNPSHGLGPEINFPIPGMNSGPREYDTLLWNVSYSRCHGLC